MLGEPWTLKAHEDSFCILYFLDFYGSMFDIFYFFIFIFNFQLLDLGELFVLQDLLHWWVGKQPGAVVFIRV